MSLSKIRERCEILKSELLIERESFIPHWRELSDFILPRRIQLSVSDTNKGDRRNQKIIDSTATISARTLRNGMMTGITSPARKWFDLVPYNIELLDSNNVKKYLYDVREKILTAFLKSNLYNVLPIIYGDIGVFGTSVLYVEEDFENHLKFYTFPIGMYCFSNNSRMEVDTFYREFRLTVRQVIEKFCMNEKGKINIDNVSDVVKNLYENNRLEQWIDISHMITPNYMYNPSNQFSKKYLSLYWETNGDKDKFLRISGYNYFPVLTIRWEVSGSDVYGTDCPGMTALGDIKELQLLHRRHAQALEKKIMPPMVAPLSLKTQKTSILPRDITYVDDRDVGKVFRPAHDININLQELDVKIMRQQERIRRAFFEDLFLLITLTGNKDMTAREIQERHEEKLLVLGAVLEQLNQDLLSPLISIAFDILNRQGVLPEPPIELNEQPLKIEYLSIMHQAQKLLGIASIERVINFASISSNVAPEILDKINFDVLIEEYVNNVGAPPKILREEMEVEGIRMQKALMQQKMLENQSVIEGSQVIKNVGSVNPTGLKGIEALIEKNMEGKPI